MGKSSIHRISPNPPLPFTKGTTYRYPTGNRPEGANVWEWTGNGGNEEKRTRGGSWWYGAFRMKAEDLATKPRDMAVV